MHQNKHVRVALAHLSRATEPNVIDDTLRGLLAEIDRLQKEMIKLGGNPNEAIRNGEDWSDRGV